MIPPAMIEAAIRAFKEQLTENLWPTYSILLSRPMGARFAYAAESPEFISEVDDRGVATEGGPVQGEGMFFSSNHCRRRSSRAPANTRRWTPAFAGMTAIGRSTQ